MPVYCRSSYAGRDDNIFRIIYRGMPAPLGFAGLGRLLGVPSFRSYYVYRLPSGENALVPRYNVRGLLLLLWQEYNIVQLGNIWRIHWESRRVEWRNDVPQAEKVDPFSMSNWIKPVRDYRATLLPQPVRKPLERRRSFPPQARSIEHVLKEWTTPTHHRRLSIITTQDDASRRRLRYL